MRKRLKLKRAKNWHLYRFYKNFTVFKIEICGMLFIRYLHTKKAIVFYTKIGHFNVVFHMTRDKWQWF